MKPAFSTSVRRVRTVPLAALRRYVVAHQDYASRARRATATDVAAEVGTARGGAARLDLDRRPRPPDHALDADRRLRRDGRLDACSAQGASSSTGRTRPACCRSRTTRSSSGGWSTSAERHWWGRERTDEGRAIERDVLARLRDEGALPVRAFEGRSEAMWGWKPAKRALEHLFAAGEVAIAGRQGFQRVYDLPERVIPKALLDAPTPSEDEFRRGYALRAVAGTRRPHRGGDRRALPLRRRREGDPPARRRARRRRASSSASRSTTAARRSSSRPARSSTARPRRRCSSARSTT